MCVRVMGVCVRVSVMCACVHTATGNVCFGQRVDHITMSRSSFDCYDCGALFTRPFMWCTN